MSWSVLDLAFTYPGAERRAVDVGSFELDAGGFTALIGPNGSGKSSLLRLLLGTLTPERGAVRFGGRALASWDRAALAREIGVVPQGEEIAFPMSVRELVAMGRYPHLGAWRREGPSDRAAVARALDRCDVTELSDRPVSTLSGGERQRARIARALAQEPRVLALDEPTVTLDVSHEMAIFELLRELAGQGVTVLLVTHNLNLAARYARRLLLLDRGRLAADGAPEEVIRQPLLEQVYRWPLQVTRHPGPGRDTGAPQVTPLARPGTAEVVDAQPHLAGNHPDPNRFP